MIVSIVLIPKIMDWLVALYSQYLYQTFKLKTGKIDMQWPFLLTIWANPYKE